MLFVQTNENLFGRIRIRSDEYVISLDKRDLPSPQLFPYLKSLKDETEYWVGKVGDNGAMLFSCLKTMLSICKELVFNWYI